MSTIADQQLARAVDAAEPTVLQAHRAVRAARLNHCRHRRARVVQRRRVRRPHVSQYRPVDGADATHLQQVSRTDSGRKRPTVSSLLAVAVAVALSLLYIILIRLLEPDPTNRVLVAGVSLIAATAAVCLNAVRLGAMTPPTEEPVRAVGERSTRHARG